MSKKPARGAATRTANMEIRRQHILECARELIAEDGFEALSLRDLAKRADVAVPTIYNLIGAKSAILERLYEDWIRPFEVAVDLTSQEDVLSGPEKFYNAVVSEIASNEAYYRAAFLARWHLDEVGDRRTHELLSRTEQIARKSCSDAKKAGILSGKVSSNVLGSLIYRSNRLAHYEWAREMIDLATFEKTMLISTYTIFCSDAAPEHVKKLQKRIRELDRAMETAA